MVKFPFIRHHMHMLHPIDSHHCDFMVDEFHHAHIFYLQVTFTTLW